MQEDTLVVADHHSWLTYWKGPIVTFEHITAEMLAHYRTVVLAPGDPKYQRSCEEIFDWKRLGLLNETRLILSTYKGRHMWTPENDGLVERWVVHARSEREVLDSDRLVFVPLCLMPPRETLTETDDGYLFLGGRKWRELDVGVAAMSRSGIPSKVISDFAPIGQFPGVEIRREKIPKNEYIDVMERARVVLVPLKGTPISHGHVDVVTAILVGKPVIVTAGASCDDYVQHGVNGLLVRDNSIEAWTEAIHEAYERADEFAAAAREMAPQYQTIRYSTYIQEVVDHPDLRLVHPDTRERDTKPDRSEWDRMIQAKAAREIKLAHQQTMRTAGEMLREQRYTEAIAEAESCLDGPLRLNALRIKMRALMRIDLAGSESLIRLLIAEAGDEAEFRTNLASSLLAQGQRAEALTEARLAVGLDPTRALSTSRLVSILVSMRQLEEARSRLLEGLSLSPEDAGLRRLQRDIETLLAKEGA